MTIPCPCCRASNDGPTCRRCKADLSLLAAVEERRRYLIGATEVELSRRGDAIAMIDEAAGLRSGADVAQLRALAALLRGEYAAAIAPILRFGGA